MLICPIIFIQQAFIPLGSHWGEEKRERARWVKENKWRKQEHLLATAYYHWKWDFFSFSIARPIKQQEIERYILATSDMERAEQHFNRMRLVWLLWWSFITRQLWQLYNKRIWVIRTSCEAYRMWRKYGKRWLAQSVDLMVLWAHSRCGTCGNYEFLQFSQEISWTKRKFVEYGNFPVTWKIQWNLENSEGYENSWEHEKIVAVIKNVVELN